MGTTATRGAEFPYVADNTVHNAMATGIATHSVGVTLINNQLENNAGSDAK